MNLGLIFSGCHRRGGVERSVYEMARWARHDHQVTVYANETDRTGLDDVAVVQVGQVGSHPGPQEFGRAAAPLIGRHEHLITFGVMDVPADVLWVNSVHRAWLQAARRLQQGPTLRHPALRYLMPAHQERLRLERRYFRRPDARLAVVVADQVGADIHRLYGFPESRLLTVHNGYDPDEFAVARSSTLRSAARERFGLPPDGPVAVMVANELGRKGLGVTLEALALVPDLHLLLVGRTAPTEFEGRARALGVDDRFHYGGAVPDTAEALAAADLFVLPTQYEAFCLAIVEALAAGLPVVTTTVPGAGDLIRDGANGERVPPNASPVVLASALSRVIERSGAAARATAAASVADHTWAELFAGAMERIALLPTL